MKKPTAVTLVLILITMQLMVYTGHSITFDERESSMEEHAPIKINNNTEFDQQAGDEDWNGTGQSDDPYIIERYTIDASGFGYGIYIANTTYYFRIRECTISNASFMDEDYHMGAGVILINISSRGDLLRNDIYDSHMGVYVKESVNTLVQGNSIYWNTEQGIFFDSVSTGDIWGNAIITFKRGVKLIDSNGTAVVANYISGGFTSITGVEQMSSSSTHIGYNHVESFQYAINITDGQYSHIQNNTIKDTLNKGLLLTRSDENLIYYNRIFNSSQEGMFLDVASSGNVIFSNNFYFNNGTSDKYDDLNISQAADQGSYNHWNDTDGRGNYWYDWARNNKTNDADGDDIIDWPYPVTTGIADYYPLSVPIYKERGRIRINNNSEFTWENGVIGGNGTEDDPFIIEGLYINARQGGDALYIGNTTRYFVVRDSKLFNASSTGISYHYGAGTAIYNATNASIMNGETHDNLHGIYIDGSNDMMIMNVNAHNNTHNGIFLNSVDTSTLTDNHCAHNGNGTAVIFSRDLVISNNSFTHSFNPLYEIATGFVFAFTGDMYIANNTFAHNQLGILQYTGEEATVIHNNISYNTGGFFGINSDNSTVMNNDFYSTGVGLLADTVTDSVYVNNYFTNMQGSMFVNNSQDLLVADNTMSTLEMGVVLNLSQSITLSHNTFTDVNVSISMELSHNNSVIDNRIDSIELAVFLNNSYWNRFYGNEMVNSSMAVTGSRRTFTTQTIPENNTVNGSPISYIVDTDGGTLSGPYGQVILGNVSNMVIGNLNISNGTAGLGMGYCSHITVRNSNFSHHMFGMYTENTTNSDIYNNVFWYNKEYGLHVGEGSSLNKIYANSFVGNNKAGEEYNESHIQANDEGYDNYWNSSYPDGGNYWSDWRTPDNYSGPDQDIPGRDGIVDEPYLIDGEADAYDHYPLVLPTYPIPPTAPENLNSTTGYNYVYLFWNEPFHDGNTDIVEYRIYRGLDPGNMTYLDSVLAPDTWYNDTAVQNGLTYYYNVTAVNTEGESPSSSLWVVPGSHPTPPLNTAAVVGDEYVHVIWEEPLDDGGFAVTEYRIYRGTSPGDEVFLDNVPYGQNNFNDTSADNWQTYHYYVTAVNERGESPPSETVSATPLPPPEEPSEPRTLAGEAGDGYVNLTWDEPSHSGNRPITEYRIFRGTSSGELSYHDTVAAPFLYYNDTNVENGETYYYSVTAVNQAELESEHSIEIEATPFGPPGPPTTVQLSEGINNVTVSWMHPDDDGGSPITGYRIYRYHDGETEMIYEPSEDTLFYVDEDIAFNETYIYSISALNPAGEGTISQEVSVTVIVWYTVPSQPLNFVVQPGNGRVILDWLEPNDDGETDVLGYRIYKGIRAGDLNIYATVSNTTFEYTDTDVENQRTYYYSLVAYNQVGPGEMTEEVSVVPDGISPVLRILSPSDNEEIEGNRVTVRWEGEDENSGISHYDIRLDEESWISVEDVTEHTFTGLSEGTHTIYLRGYDNAGNLREEGVTFRVVSTSTIIPQSITDNWWMIFIISVLIIAAVAAVMLYNKRPTPIKEPSSEAVIEEVFLISHSSLLIAHNTRRLKPDMDDDILAGMLTAVQNFIKDSFKDEGDWRLNRLEFANNKIIVERGDHVYMAVMYSGKLDKDGLQKIKDTIEHIEEEYGEYLKDWDGDMNNLRGVKDILREIF